MRRLAALVLALTAFAVAQGQQNLPRPYPDQPYLVLDTGGHSAAVRRIAFTPDGQYLLTASADKTLRFWDLVTGETVRTFRPPIGLGSDGSLEALAVSPDGKRLAVGGVTLGPGRASVLVYLVDIATGKVERTVKGHKGGISALAFTLDSKRLVSASHDSTIRVYDVATGKQDQVLEGHKDSVRGIALSPDSKRLASISDDRTGRIWSLVSGKTEATLQDVKLMPLSIAWSGDGKTLAVGHLEAAISLFNTDGKLRKTVTDLRNQMTSVTFTADSRELLFTGVGYGGNNAQEFGSSLLDVESGKERVRFRAHQNTVQHGALSRDGKLAASTGGNDHETFVWNTKDGALVHRLTGKGQSVWAVGWAPDGSSIAWGHTNRADRSPLERGFDLDELDFTKVAFDKCRRADLQRGNRSFGLNNRFHLTIKEGDRVLTTFFGESQNDRVYSFTWLSDDRVIAGTAFGLYLIEPTTGKIVRKFVGHSGLTLAVAPSPDGRYFLTGSSDQTLRIWDPQRPDPVLSLFVADHDWIAWTQEGVYAASADGERLMGWHINNDAEQPAGYYPAAQFRRSLYHPDVVSSLRASGMLAKAFTQAGKKPTAALSVTQVLPPTVAITSPSGLGTVKVPQGKFEVKAAAKSVGKHPVTALRLLVDGRPYQGQTGVRPIAAPKLGDATASWTVELPPGTHHLAVQAESTVSRALSPPVEVAVPGKETELPALYLLAVGINAYPKGMELDYAAGDADALAQVLKARSSKAFRTVEVKVIKDKEATKKGIEEGLAWLGAKMTPHDVGIFSFSGHGDRDDKGAFYLVPADISARDPYGTCLSGDRVKTLLGNMPGRVIALLDACHAGAAGQRRPAAADDLVRDLVTEDYGIIVMSAALGREYALEGRDAKHGYFTLALLEGLSGGADVNRDGSVYLHELDRYAFARVKQLSADKQHPVMARPAALRSFILSKP